jgi:hypothetical protein
MLTGLAIWIFNMEAILCRNCNKMMFNDYLGYCSSSCFAEFGSKNLFINSEIEMQTCKDQDVIDDLESQVYRLEDELNVCEGDAYRELEDALSEVEELEVRNNVLEGICEELRGNDWNKIEAERKAEKEYEEELLQKVQTIKEMNDELRSHNGQIVNQNKMLLDQNLDLLKTIKNLEGYSERFDLLDLGIELIENE